MYIKSVCRHVWLINITIFSTEALPWNLVVQDHWRLCLLIPCHLGCVLLASSLQAHRSADKCLARCLYSNGVVQAVTFGYLIYWLVLVAVAYNVHFRPLPPSCLLVQWESSRLLCFRFAVRSHCRVIFLKNLVLFLFVFYITFQL